VYDINKYNKIAVKEDYMAAKPEVLAKLTSFPLPFNEGC
jgi:hypothetical protein